MILLGGVHRPGLQLDRLRADPRLVGHALHRDRHGRRRRPPDAAASSRRSSAATDRRLGEHPFGQDNIGKDYFALTMRGPQQSIIIAFIVGIVATLVGTVVGALAGYFRGRLETVLMRFTDVMITIPLLVIAAVVGRMAGNAGIVMLGVVLGLVVWTQLARLVRGEFLSLREKEFVEAARAVGTRPVRIIFRHILPNAIGVIIVSATLTIASAVLLETALSFLGFGVQKPDTSLGLLISEYRSAMLTSRGCSGGPVRSSSSSPSPSTSSATACATPSTPDRAGCAADDDAVRSPGRAHPRGRTEILDFGPDDRGHGRPPCGHRPR